jgi:hypothetical protein
VITDFADTLQFNHAEDLLSLSAALVAFSTV